MLWRIEAPHFVAGVEIENGVVTRAAPILRYMMGWQSTRVLKYVRTRNWQFTLPSKVTYLRNVTEAT